MYIIVPPLSAMLLGPGHGPNWSWAELVMCRTRPNTGHVRTHARTHTKFKFNFFFFLQNVIAVFVFSDRGVKMLVKCLQICAHVFIDRPQNCAKTSCHSCAGLRPNFVHSCSKLGSKLRTKLARILVVHALDCAQFFLHPALFPT